MNISKEVEKWRAKKDQRNLLHYTNATQVEAATLTFHSGSLGEGVSNYEMKHAGPHTYVVDPVLKTQRLMHYDVTSMFLVLFKRTGSVFGRPGLYMKWLW